MNMTFGMGEKGLEESKEEGCNIAPSEPCKLQKINNLDQSF